jgi:hypothetical protein
MVTDFCASRTCACHGTSGSIRRPSVLAVLVELRRATASSRGADHAWSLSPARWGTQAVLALCEDRALELPPGAGLPRQGPEQPSPPPPPPPDLEPPAWPAPPDPEAPALAAPRAAPGPAGAQSGPEVRQAAASAGEGADGSCLRALNAVPVAGRARTLAEETSLQGPAATGPGCAAAAAPAEGPLLTAQLAASAGAAAGSAVAAADPAGSGSPAARGTRASASAHIATASAAGGGAVGAAGGSVGPGPDHGVGAPGCSAGPAPAASGAPGHPPCKAGAQAGSVGGDGCASIKQALPAGAAHLGADEHQDAAPSHHDQLGQGLLACAPALPHAAPNAPAAAQPVRAGDPAPGGAASARACRPAEGLPAAGPACGGSPTPHLAQSRGAPAAAGCRGGDLAAGGSTASAGGEAEDDLVRVWLAAQGAASNEPALAPAAVGTHEADTRGAAAREEGRAAAPCGATGAVQHAAGPDHDARASVAAPGSPAAARCQGVDGPDQARPEGGRADAGAPRQPGQGPAADPGSEPSGRARKRRADDSGGDGHAEREAAAKRARMVALRCDPGGRARACWAGEEGQHAAPEHAMSRESQRPQRPEDLLWQGCVPCVGPFWRRPSLCRPTRLRCDKSASHVTASLFS